MERIEVKDTPAGATNYKLDDGRIVRVHLKVLTPESEIPTADMLAVQTNGYEINKDGAFIVDDNGEPITLAKNVTSVPLASIRNGSDNMNGGWVETDLAYDPENPRADVADVRQLKTLPKTGAANDRVYAKDDKKTYVYNAGQYETIRLRRAAEMAAVVSAPVPLEVQAILPT